MVVIADFGASPGDYGVFIADQMSTAWKHYPAPASAAWSGAIFNGTIGLSFAEVFDPVRVVIDLEPDGPPVGALLDDLAKFETGVLFVDELSDGTRSLDAEIVPGEYTVHVSVSGLDGDPTFVLQLRKHN